MSLHAMLGKQMKANPLLNSSCSTLTLGDVTFGDKGLNQFANLSFLIIPGYSENVSTINA
jgi:hypothetical protein